MFRFRPIAAVTAALALTLVADGCASKRPQSGGAAQARGASPPAPVQRTTLRVNNQGFPDMTIYVVRSGSQRIRLGLAGGNRSTVLPLPNYLVPVSTPLRFLADPIGGSRTPVSDEITVNPGDEVVLTIPPG